jgi:hypothetical protein
MSERLWSVFLAASGCSGPLDREHGRLLSDGCVLCNSTRKIGVTGIDKQQTGANTVLCQPTWDRSAKTEPAAPPVRTWLSISGCL